MPTRTCAFVGAPFCEGQNLEGADLGPSALREAGIGRGAQKLGWNFEDLGDLNFAAHFESVGLGDKNGEPHFDKLALYREWLAETGMHTNFSTWVADKNREALVNLATDDALAPAPKRKKTQGVVNAERMGSGLRLIHEVVLKAAKAGHFVLTVGGDHSIASGSISALCEAHPGLGVVWIDAHADANTPGTSPSGHYHGMPAAHLMGWFGREKGGDEDAAAGGLRGFEWFTPGCLPEGQLAYIGLRDIDPEEGEALTRSGVHAFTMRDVDKYGIAKVCEMAVAAVSGPDGKAPLHLSLDIDGVDPHFAPGTGTCARGGLTYREVHYICEECALSRRLVSMDLVEVSPSSSVYSPLRLHADGLPHQVEVSPSSSLYSPLRLRL
jgi:arginase